jgi:hypothetical protein
MTEVGNSLYSYFTYALDYIKLARNIYAANIAAHIIDADGNLSRYVDKYEIVQVIINNEDITINAVAR